MLMTEIQLLCSKLCQHNVPRPTGQVKKRYQLGNYLTSGDPTPTNQPDISLKLIIFFVCSPLCWCVSPYCVGVLVPTVLVC